MQYRLFDPFHLLSRLTHDPDAALADVRYPCPAIHQLHFELSPRDLYLALRNSKTIEPAERHDGVVRDGIFFKAISLWYQT